MAGTHFKGPVTATNGFVGALTGNVTGNLAGDIAGTTITSLTTAGSGAGAVPITGSIHEITTTGTGDALTLAAGTEGQHLFIVYVAEGAAGDTAVLTPAAFTGGTNITFTNLGDSAHLLFTNAAWFVVAGNGVTIA